MSSDQVRPSKLARDRSRYTLLEGKYGKRLRRDIKVVKTANLGELTESDYEELTEESTRLREEVFRCRFAEPKTLTARQKEDLGKELKYLSGEYQSQEKEKKGYRKALPDVSSYRTNDDEIRAEFDIIQTYITTFLTEYISIDKARQVINLGVLPNMSEGFTNYYRAWAETDDNTRTLLRAYINSRLYEYVFCPPGPHSNWPAPGSQFRKEGPWVLTQWDMGFGLSAFKYFEEIEGPVREKFPELLPDMHELRARMATFIDHLHGCSSFDQDAQAVDDVYGKGICRMVFDNPGKQLGYLQLALATIHKAFDLVVKLKRSKADWVFVRDGGDGPPDDRKWIYLQAAMGNAGRGFPLVVVVPGLLRVGDEDGNTFTGDPVVVKELTAIWGAP